MVHSLITAFILLGIGTFAAISILVIEHLYMKYLQKHHASGSATGWLALLSQVPNKPTDQNVLIFTFLLFCYPEFRAKYQGK